MTQFVTPELYAHLQAAFRLVPEWHCRTCCAPNRMAHDHCGACGQKYECDPRRNVSIRVVDGRTRIFNLRDLTNA